MYMWRFVPILTDQKCKIEAVHTINKKMCCAFTGISLRAETQIQLPGSFSFPEEIPPSPGHPSEETLQESMTRLDRGLTSGTLLMQFEVRIYKHMHMRYACFYSRHVCLKHVRKLVDEPCMCVF